MSWSPSSLRIVVLAVEPDAWCDVCGLPCASTISYVQERADRLPDAVHRLTYCEECEERSAGWPNSAS